MFFKYWLFRINDCLSLKCKVLKILKVYSIYKEYKKFVELLQVYGYYDKFCAWAKCNKYFINMPVFRQILKTWLDEKATDYPSLLRQLFVPRK